MESVLRVDGCWSISSEAAPISQSGCVSLRRCYHEVITSPVNNNDTAKVGSMLLCIEIHNLLLTNQKQLRAGGSKGSQT